MSRRSALLSAVLLAGAAVLAHGHGLRGELLGADRALVDRSPLAAAPAAAGGAVASFPAWASTAVAASSLGCERAVFGASALALRASNLVLHLAATLLFFFLVLQWTALPLLSLLAALIFAVHPVSVEALDTAAGRGEILAAGLSFLCLILIGCARKTETRGGARAAFLTLAFATHLVATFSSPIALTIPVVLAVFDTVASGGLREAARRWGVSWGLFALASVPSLATTLALAPPAAPANRWLAGRALLEALRAVALPYPLDYYRILGPASGPDAASLACLPVAAALVVFVLLVALVRREGPLFGRMALLAGRPALLAIALVPVLWAPVAFVAGGTGPVVWLGLAIGALLLALLAFGARSQIGSGRSATPLVLGSLLLVLPCLALVIIPPAAPDLEIPFPLQDHRLYLAAAGGGLLFGAFLSGRTGAARHVTGRGSGRIVSMLAALAVVLPFAAASVHRHGVFETDTILYAATAASSPSTHLRVLLAQAASARGQGAKAIEVAKRLVVRAPGDASLHLLLANLLRDVRDLDASAEEARAALRLDRSLGAAHVTLGLIERERGNPAGAEEEYREAIRLDPSLDEAHSNLGAILSTREATAEALAELKLAVQLDPSNGDAAANLASLFLEQKLGDEAIAVLRKGLDLSAGNPRLHYVLGVALQRKGDPDGAVPAYLEAIRLDPAYMRPRFNLAAIYSDQKRFEESVEQLGRVIEREPRNERAHYQMGLAYRSLGKTDLASAEFYAALRIRPDFAEANRALTGMFSSSGTQPGSSRRP